MHVALAKWDINRRFGGCTARLPTRTRPMGHYGCGKEMRKFRWVLGSMLPKTEDG